MDFESIEKEIEELNRIKPNSNHKNRDRYYELYRRIYESLLVMENEGRLVIDPSDRGLGYLQQLLENDGPEFCYRIEFREKNSEKKYKIGVCIRGLPICKPVE